MEKNALYQKWASMAEKVLQTESCAMSTTELIEQYHLFLEQIAAESLSPRKYNSCIDGVSDAFTLFEVASLDMKAFNARMKILRQGVDYDSYLRLVDRLLPQPKVPYEDGEIIEIPAETRPHITYHLIGKVSGCIGRMYMHEEGMHMYYPYCDIFSEETPKELVKRGVNLLYSDVVVSEVLKCLQGILDPAHERKHLADAIAACEVIERKDSDPLYHLLFEHGIAAVCLNAYDACPRYYEPDACGDIYNLYLTPDGKVRAGVLISDYRKYKNVQITQKVGCYDWLLENVKRALNIAKNKVPVR